MRETLQTVFPELDCILYEQIKVFEGALPAGTRFSDDIWDVLSWERLPRNRKAYNIFFNKFRNADLKVAAKFFVLWQRANKKTTGSSAVQFVHAVLQLDETCMPEWRLTRLSNHTFLETEGRLLEQLPPDSSRAYTITRYLEAFGAFLHQNFGLPIGFQSSVPRPRPAGQDGTAEAREARLIPNEVIRDLLALRGRSNLSWKDELCVHMLMILVATGFRVSELLTLAHDCLHDVNGTLSIHYYSVKRAQMDLKPIMAVLAPAVRAAFERIRELTDSGRVAAQNFRVAEQTNTQGMDWDLILADERATTYFVGQVLYRWTSDPQHQLLNPAGAWWDSERKYVDVLTVLAEEGGNRSEVARRLQIPYGKVGHLINVQMAAQKGLLPTRITDGGEVTSFHKDSRVVSVSGIARILGFYSKDLRIREMVDKAADLQLKGEVYMNPTFNQELEDQFRRKSQALICGDGNKRYLEAWDALFVFARGETIEKSDSKNKDYQVMTIDFLIKALYDGKKVHQSLFGRWGIVDPRTKSTAVFTTGQIRQWLNTMYLRGGLTHEQAALIMGHDVSMNVQYDQRGYLEREEDLQYAVRSGRTLGYVADVYIALADHDISQAEEFLRASLKRYMIMPHGACVRDLRLDPCPNHLACFAALNGDEIGICPDLVIDSGQPNIRSHLDALERSQDAMLTVLQPTWPQHDRAATIKRNVSASIHKLNLIYG